MAKAADVIIEQMIEQCRIALRKEVPHIMDLYMFGDTDEIKVTYTGTIRRSLDKGICIDMDGAFDFELQSSPMRVSWWRRLWRCR